ncbi:hypothetical protein CTEN210_17868 [Chaetoceros tenuissimus]|uniref:ATP-dependent (S)-NAD(P)H-hydrate dehydratase n=1 Tax=Chaetoceros tenuissimus TaxID=426638 RepID=A0AAD3DBC9_9STRA|nr:hypothetical protein CTEN210_17868 [Chaetoceros tenuissimus]
MHEYKLLRTLTQLESSHLLPSILKRTIPQLDSNCYKGSSGRIGILGGSEKYTGAPYYAAMSALRTGADLATVFCAQEAAIPIKSYSPELMVDSVYSASNMQSDDENIVEKEIDDMVHKVVSSLERLHCVVIGPGLGRDVNVLKATARIIQEARQLGVNLVLDADALYLLSLKEYHYLILKKSQSECTKTGFLILTPNVVEYKRLVDNVANGNEDEFRQSVEEMIVIKKGHHDVIETIGVPSNSDENILISEEQGGLKRSGGIGDVLCGVTGSFSAWNRILSNQAVEEPSTQDKNTSMLLSCWLASAVTKRSTKNAFDKRKRSMTAPDILEEIGDIVDHLSKSTIAR